MAFRNLNDNESVQINTNVRMNIPIKISGVSQTDKIVFQAHRSGSFVSIYGLDLSTTWHLENGVPTPDHVGPQWRTSIPQAAIQFDL